MSGNWKSAVLSLALLAAPAWAQLPAVLEAREPALAARGTGAMRWLGLKLYDATLYTEAGAPFSWERPFALKLSYARDVDGAAIAQVSRDEMDRFGQSEAERARWYARMSRLFPDVRRGDAIVGLMDGAGAAFWHNGRYLGRIDETAFARRFFSIWLDGTTREPRLREALLGRGAP